jgi:hypothetical protein
MDKIEHENNQISIFQIPKVFIFDKIDYFFDKVPYELQHFSEQIKKLFHKNLSIKDSSKFFYISVVLYKVRLKLMKFLFMIINVLLRIQACQKQPLVLEILQSRIFPWERESNSLHNGLT